jgi:hypothetical protein
VVPVFAAHEKTPFCPLTRSGWQWWMTTCFCPPTGFN